MQMQSRSCRCKSLKEYWYRTVTEGVEAREVTDGGGGGGNADQGISPARHGVGYLTV
jgi:hypothetical protein